MKSLGWGPYQHNSDFPSNKTKSPNVFEAGSDDIFRRVGVRNAIPQEEQNGNGLWEWNTGHIILKLITGSIIE